MLAQFVHYLRNDCAVEPTDKVLLACSGGIDSMVLAYLLKQVEQPFSLAHCNFQLRGDESDKDEQSVKQWAAEHAVEFHSRRFDTQTTKLEQGGSTQMVARKLRYDWFNELKIATHCDLVATAHHLDDSIETCLINLTRGSGLSGLTGIDARTGDLIRPLLFATKGAITEFAIRKQLTWREDQSNATDNYLRNRVRHTLIPMFEKENPQWKFSMQATLSHLDQANQSLSKYFEQLRSTVETSPGCFVIGDLNQIKPLSIFLHHCFFELGFTTSQLSDLENALTQSEEKIFLAKNYRLIISRDHLKLDPIQERAFSLEINNWQSLINLPGIKHVELIPNSPQLLLSIKSAGKQFCYLDFGLLDFPLKAGNWTEGDRFTPMGMTGSKLVSDFFIDLKLDKIEKERQIILRSSKNDIIWIAGKRLDNRFKVTENTSQVLKLELLNS